MTESWKKWEGQVVDGTFHLREYLGGSDHGGVFLTEYREPEPGKAAIKLVPADSENADLQLSRWERAATLSHPHLTRIFQTGRCRLGDERLLYIVMEYGEEDLSQIIPQRPLTAGETQDMLRPLLDALTYLHGEGLVHGHIKPSNIMAIDDQLRISSDGICAAGEMKVGREKPNAYDAPETATRGQFPAGDVWSLGVTLTEILTQQLPKWEWKGQEEAALPKMLPAPFHDIVRDCLRRDPQVRPTVADIAARLQPLSQTPEMASSAKLQTASAKGRHNAAAAAVVLVVALIVGAVRMINHHSEAQAPPTIVVDKPVPQVNPGPSPPTPAAQPSEAKAVKDPSIAAAPASPAASSPVATESKADAKAPQVSLTKGDVVHQVLPDVPQTARDTIQGTVRIGVRVQVDPSGNVTGAELDSAGPSKYFANLAMKAAREWKFTPAKASGQGVASEWILRFQISQDGTKAIPTETTP